MEESRLSILCMTLDMVETDCYLIWDRGSKGALLIDPADDAAQIKGVIRERDLSLKALLLTHGHFDHVLAASALRDAFQVPLCAVETEAEMLWNPELNNDARWFRQGPSLKADRLFHDKKKPPFLGTEIEVLFTPGYTADFCRYYFPAEKLLFPGDTLFEGSFRHVDLPGGNVASLEHSLGRPFESPTDALALLGHTGQTNIGEERKGNPVFYY